VSSGDTTVVSASWSASENAVVGYVQPQSYPRRVVLMAVNGPANTTLRVYEGYRQLVAHLRTAVFPADIRTYDAATQGALTFQPGCAYTFAWTGGAAGAGQTATAMVQSDTG
jgi:hypothetical protein